MAISAEPARPRSVDPARAIEVLVSAAVGRLDAVAHDPVASVHGARKAIRSARAVLLLMRPALGEDRYRAGRDALREAAAALSAHRDSHVVPGAFDALASRAGLAGSPGADSVRRAVVREVSTTSLGADAARSAGSLRGFLVGLRGWPGPARDLGASVADGLERSVRRARKLVRRAMREPTDERLHDLRKRCKDLREQLTLLGPLRPRRYGRMARAHARVCGLLGEARDIRLVLGALGRLRADGADERAVIDALRERGLRRLDKLERRALVRACEATAMRPRKLARDVRRRW